MKHHDPTAPLPPEYRIRQCRREDLFGVIHVDAMAFAGHDLFPGFFFVQALDICGDGFLIADFHNEIVGYAIAARRQDEVLQGWILSTGVLPDHQRRGIGSNLTAQVELFLARAGVSATVLTVDPENATALRFYQRLGYEQVSRFPDHFGEREDRILMKRRLN
ncbi:GNAT family N-acetyltransferase [Cryptosporangium aurantiacum]|uniref:Ribosomal protein S18 acetylase RimI n=1 Tax=Cryptosporangium aurantiacum TaxID=134849 RepID=A0A1M7RJS3_9ACTN|nr:N-acetyltransferase [Cryptosporangium aurantiacum]SHN46401.1 Ribosomal protein S18 acetylase RimI [Cryptosporangium aurantiacum]